MVPRETVAQFDDHLVAVGLTLDAVVIGGAALALLGVVGRQTRDVDILEPVLPIDIVHAARAFAVRERASGADLQDDWLNNGPLQLAETLPTEWRERTEVVFVGRAITLRTLGRPDLLRSKMFALCDRGLDLGDCLALKPTPDELAEIAPWLEQRDMHPEWPAHVRATLVDLGERLGHAV